MEGQKKFEEGIGSYGTRVANELDNLRLGLPSLSDPRNTPSSKRIQVQYMRRSLDKLNSYFHNIEMIVEKEYAANVESSSENVKGVSIPRGENLQKEST